MLERPGPVIVLAAKRRVGVVSEIAIRRVVPFDVIRRGGLIADLDRGEGRHLLDLETT